MKKIKRKIIEAGRIVWEEHLVTSHGGNISFMESIERIYITNTGTKLGFLEEKDISIIPLKATREEYPHISSEWTIHRTIYEKTNKKAIIHAHPLAVVTLSLLGYKVIEAIDREGMLTFTKAPVIEDMDDKLALANVVAENLKEYYIVCIKGHGTFSAANTLEEAIFYTSSLEFSAKIILNLLYAGKSPLI